MKIEIDIDAIQHCSSNIININQELQQNMNDIENLVLCLGQEWQGETEKAYTNNILIVKKQFTYLNNFIAEYANMLRVVADKYSQLETDIKLKMEGVK